MAKKILVIDDDPLIVKLVTSRLQSAGFDVVAASDGQSGLEQASSHDPDLIICDIMMPKMDGYTFVTEYKGKDLPRKVPIIVLTAKQGMKDLFEMEGVSDYIVKPFDGDELIQKINKYLNKE